MSTNKSGIHPRGFAVLIEPYEPEIKSSIIQLPDEVAKRGQMLEQRARVVEVGPECWKGESVPRAGAGDLVLVTKFAGYMAVGPKDGRQYRLVNDRDIFAGIEEERH